MIKKKNKLLRNAMFSFLLCSGMMILNACTNEEELTETDLTPTLTQAAWEHVVPTRALNPTAGVTATVMPTPEGNITENATQFPEGSTPSTSGEVADITPIPNLHTGEPAFMEMFRILPQGTRINTEGVSVNELMYCFFAAELSDKERNMFVGQAGFDEESVQKLQKIRVLFYRSEQAVYIGDIIVKSTENGVSLREIRTAYLMMFLQKQRMSELAGSELPKSLQSEDYQADILEVEGARYLLIYK